MTCSEFVDAVKNLKHFHGNLSKLQEFASGIGIKPFGQGICPVCWRNYVTAIDSYELSDGLVEVRGIFFIPEDLELTDEDISWDFDCEARYFNKESESCTSSLKK